MGDFKLKSDKAFLPPPAQRMTAARKKQQARRLPVRRFGRRRTLCGLRRVAKAALLRS